MNIKTFLFVIASLISLTSCSKKSENYIHIFYNAKYRLMYAAYNNSYKVGSEPAYFRSINGSVNCADLFNLENSYCIYCTEVIDDNPIGRGEIKVDFKDSSLEDFHVFFDYYSGYDRGYGGQIQTVNCEINEIGTQHVRGKYWWTRMDCVFPQLDYKRVILEFGNPTAYDDLEEFEDNTIFS